MLFIMVFPAFSFLNLSEKGKDATLKHILSRDGTRISYVCRGSGPALLLVHGTTADHRRWSGISSLLEHELTVYAMDRRGRGASSDARGYTLMNEAEDIAAMVDAIGEAVVVLGHSYGALCAMEAVALTDSVPGLILYEPPLPPFWPPISQDVTERMREMMDEGRKEDALEFFMRDVVCMPEHELSAYRELPMWQHRIQLAGTILTEAELETEYHFDPDKFRDIRIPVMMLAGGDSPEFSHRIADHLGAVFPNSSIVKLPGQQHIAMDTDPELFVRTVLNFVRTVTAETE